MKYQPSRGSGIYQVQAGKPQPIIKRVSNYEYNEADFLGRGSFAKVYKGINKNTNEIVAVKVIELRKLREQQLTELLVEECKIINSVDHPNIVKCHEVLTSENNCYIITELCDGGDLLNMIKSKKTLPFNTSTWKIIFQIYQALKYLNQRQIVHRDIKSANILFHKGVAKLADFGFAKKIFPALFKDIFLGSPFYMSPEGTLKQVYGPKTDVWSFGILLYELFHGHTPFYKCANKKELLKQVVRPLSHQRVNENIPKDLKDLILSCLTVQQQKRITIAEIENTQFFRKVLKELNMQTIHKSPSIVGSKICSNSFLPTQTDLFSPYSNFGSNGKNKSIRVDKKHQNSNRMNLLMGQRDNLQIHHSADTKFQVLAQTNQKENSRLLGVVLPQTISNQAQTLTPPPPNVHEIRQPSRERQKFQKHQFKITNEILGYSVKTFKECLSILHYCRLCFKTFSFLQSQNLTESLPILSSWITKLLDEIKYLAERNQIDFSESTNPQERQQKLKQVVRQYINKYSKQLIYKSGSAFDINVMVDLTANIWKQVDYPGANIVIKHYALYLAETTLVLKEALQKKDMSEFIENTNLEGFLCHKTSCLNEDTYESLRCSLSC